MLFYPWRDQQLMTDAAADIHQNNLIQINENRANYVYNEDLISVVQHEEDKQTDPNVTPKLKLLHPSECFKLFSPKFLNSQAS